MTRVAVGGTFDPLHDGHKALLLKAVELSRGGELLIGLTSDEMARKKVHEVNDYRSRYEELMKFINAQGVFPQIVKLNDDNSKLKKSLREKDDEIENLKMEMNNPKGHNKPG